MSTPVSSGGSFEFLFEPSEEALKEVMEIIMRKSDEQTFSDTS